MPGRYSSTAAWRNARLATLARDGGVCQIRGERCTWVATEADHIVEVTAGGALYDLANLRAACKPCNARLLHWLNQPAIGLRAMRCRAT